MIDLRSDTVTKPTAAMRAAMAAADVGDSQYDEDPTVRELECEVAKVLGKEAALFVPSGTMGNLVCVLAQCKHGEEAIVGDEAHIFYYELAGSAGVGGVQLRTIPNHDGVLEPHEIAQAIRERDEHYPRTALICMENTHNRGGGTPISVEQTEAIARVAGRHGIPLHLDGSRLFNAAVALAAAPGELCKDAASVNVCFSKGLGAPVGSAVAGTRAFTDKARTLRKMLGGGMRQAGVIAAAALIALREGPKRLEADHKNAKALAGALLETGKFDLDPKRVRTNMVVFSPRAGGDPDELVAKWARAGVLVSQLGGGRFRAVTHQDVTREDVLHAARLFASS